MPPSDEMLETRWVSATQLREMFNDRDLYGKALSGELTAVTRKDSPLKTPTDDLPMGTRSQTVEYLDMNGDLVALVHQYLLPDGSLGASGLPDPKKLILDRCIYAIPSPDA